MGVLEIAVVAVILIAGTVGGSAVAGAVLGRDRGIGAGKGFGWGLLLPVIGLGRVLASPKKERTAEQRKDAPDSIERRQMRDAKESAREAARERFRKDNPKSDTPARKPGSEAAPENSQSQSRGVRQR